MRRVLWPCFLTVVFVATSCKPKASPSDPVGASGGDHGLTNIYRDSKGVSEVWRPDHGSIRCGLGLTWEKLDQRSQLHIDVLLTNSTGVPITLWQPTEPMRQVTVGVWRLDGAMVEPKNGFKQLAEAMPAQIEFQRRGPARQRPVVVEAPDRTSCISRFNLFEALPMLPSGAYRVRVQPNLYLPPEAGFLQSTNVGAVEFLLHLGGDLMRRD